jgi:hypothetical protein
VCKGTSSDQQMPDSWEMCTTSIECRNVMTAVLTVMSGMDPHTIRETWFGTVGMLGWLVSCSLGRTTTVDSVVGLMSCFEKKR